MEFAAGILFGLLTAALAVITALLFSIHKELHKMALSQADFDTKLNTLQASVTALLAIPATPPVDLTSEGATVDALNTSVQAAITAATPPAPAPAPTP